jgi:hypothetical protein
MQESTAAASASASTSASSGHLILTITNAQRKTDTLRSSPVWRGTRAHSQYNSVNVRKSTRTETSTYFVKATGGLWTHGSVLGKLSRRRDQTLNLEPLVGNPRLVSPIPGRTAIDDSRHTQTKS